MKVVGLRETNFTANDGTVITGTQVFVTYVNDHVEGVATDKFFVSFRLQNSSNYLPCVGDEVDVYYNKYGKISRIEKI